MMQARKAPQGSGNRLDGKLMLLINDEWVVDRRRVGSNPV